jgi:hypothetical protein
MSKKQAQDLEDQGKVTAKSIVNAGSIAESLLTLASEPANNDTFTIGTQLFKYVAALGAPTTFMQVKTGTGFAATLTAAVDAVNGVSNPLVVQATTPFTEPVLAINTTFNLRLFHSSARGVAPAIVGVSPSIPLASSLTDPSSGWSLSNLNQSPGTDATALRSAVGSLIVQPEQVSVGALYIILPFVPSKALFQAGTVFFPGTIAPKYIDEIITLYSDPTISEAVISVGFGVTPLIAGDQLTFQIFE